MLVFIATEYHLLMAVILTSIFLLENARDEAVSRLFNLADTAATAKMVMIFIRSLLSQVIFRDDRGKLAR